MKITSSHPLSRAQTRQIEEMFGKGVEFSVDPFMDDDCEPVAFIDEVMPLHWLLCVPLETLRELPI